VIRVRPRQNLLDGVVREELRVSLLSVNEQQLRQRTSLGQPSMPLDERLIDGTPRQARSILDFAIGVQWPAAVPHLERINPFQNLADVKHGSPRLALGWHGRSAKSNGNPL
jgi:hypothetical protein